MEYAAALDASQAVDLERGYTHVGPQRADIRVTINGRSAADVLSRGQQKLVVCALKLAQGQLMANLGHSACTYLLDDLSAELDKHHCGLVCAQLSSMKVQVFATCIEEDDLCSVWPSEDGMKVFHVEHGVVTPVEPIID